MTTATVGTSPKQPTFTTGTSLSSQKQTSAAFSFGPAPPTFFPLATITPINPSNPSFLFTTTTTKSLFPFSTSVITTTSSTYFTTSNSTTSTSISSKNNTTTPTISTTTTTTTSIQTNTTTNTSKFSTDVPSINTVVYLFNSSSNITNNNSTNNNQLNLGAEKTTTPFFYFKNMGSVFQNMKNFSLATTTYDNSNDLILHYGSKHLITNPISNKILYNNNNINLNNQPLLFKKLSKLNNKHIHHTSSNKNIFPYKLLANNVSNVKTLTLFDLLNANTQQKSLLNHSNHIKLLKTNSSLSHFQPNMDNNNNSSIKKLKLKQLPFNDKNHENIQFNSNRHNLDEIILYTKRNISSQPMNTNSNTTSTISTISKTTTTMPETTQIKTVLSTTPQTEIYLSTTALIMYTTNSIESSSSSSTTIVSTSPTTISIQSESTTSSTKYFLIRTNPYLSNINNKKNLNSIKSNQNIVLKNEEIYLNHFRSKIKSFRGKKEKCIQVSSV